MTQKTILIADDEPHLTYMLARKLEALGFAVVIADNGAAGLALALEHEPALIITDYQMPGMNGLEMCLELRQRAATARIPAIMLTARGHRLAESDLARAGIRALLTKPFSLKAVFEQVNALLALDAGASDGATTHGANAP